MDAAGAGGSGGGCESGWTTRDVRLAARALGECWDLPADARRAMVVRLAAVVGDPTSPPRSFFAAARTLTHLSRINLAAVDATIRAEAHEDLARRLDELERRLAEDGRLR